MLPCYVIGATIRVFSRCCNNCDVDAGVHGTPLPTLALARLCACLPKVERCSRQHTAWLVHCLSSAFDSLNNSRQWFDNTRNQLGTTHHCCMVNAYKVPILVGKLPRQHDGQSNPVVTTVRKITYSLDDANQVLSSVVILNTGRMLRRAGLLWDALDEEVVECIIQCA